MAQSKEFADASHALNDLSHALALLESENASLRGAVEGLCNENAKLRELCKLCEREAENRKLRELVRDMYEMAYPEYPSAFDAAFADRLRELGVEA